MATLLQLAAGMPDLKSRYLAQHQIHHRIPPMTLLEKFLQANVDEFKKLRLDVTHLEAHLESLFEGDKTEVATKVESVATAASTEVKTVETAVTEEANKATADVAAVVTEEKNVEAAAVAVEKAA
jgi:hypothetical protein